MFRRHQMRDQRLARRPFQRVHGRQQGRNEIDVPDSCLAGQRQDGQNGGNGHVEPFGEKQQRPPVARVGQHTAEESEQDDRHHPHQAERAQTECLCAQLNGTSE